MSTCARPTRAFRFLLSFLEGVAEAALYCAHRTSTFLLCAFCEQEGHLVAPFPSLLRPRVGRAQKANRLSPSPFFSSPYPPKVMSRMVPLLRPSNEHSLFLFPPSQWGSGLPALTVRASIEALPPLQKQLDETAFSQQRASNEGLLRSRVARPPPYPPRSWADWFSHCARRTSIF